MFKIDCFIQFIVANCISLVPIHQDLFPNTIIGKVVDTLYVNNQL